MAPLEDLPDFDTLSSSELLAILELPAGREGLRYYMSKADKIAYLRSDQPLQQEAILARARKAQIDHHAYLAARRARGGKQAPGRAELVEAKLSNHTWRYVKRLRAAAGFRDAVTGRKARVMYLLEDISSGDVLKVTKSTVQDAFERLDNILDWPPAKSRAEVPLEGAEPTAQSLPSRLKALHRR